MAQTRRNPVQLLVLTLAMACAPAAQSAQVAQADHAHHGAHEGLPELKPIPSGALHVAADVHFMQGMIAHHGQAIHMSKLAESRADDPRLVRFAQKIDQSQVSEIALMQEWLRERGQVAPDTSAYHSITMPGMLTKEQLAELAGLRGKPFDRRFLELMIQHHEGAILMVKELLATPRAAQDVDVNVLANEIEVVQTTEINLMKEMLATNHGVR